jgi:sigma-E factor negative regulatory protein RseA
MNPLQAPVGHVEAHHADATGTHDATDGVSARVSAYMDGALAAAEMSDDFDSPELGEAWHCYHLIGEALRSVPSEPFVSSLNALHTPAARRSAALIVQRAGEVEATEPLPELARSPEPAVVVLRPRYREAANDGVFRWKLVSGLASVVAVLGVAWGLAGVPGSLPGGMAGGAELAAHTTPAPQAAAMAVGAPVLTADAVPAAAGVLVSTPNGQMLRDPRLEALMQAHRQAGGALALQVPAGFMRNATFEAHKR